MRELMRVYRRELGAYFASPIAYLFIGVFLAVTLFAFFWGEAFFARNIADVQPLFKWMPLLLIALVAALTMRSWSEERRADTLELLLTSPVSSLTLTGGKFLAALSLVAVSLVLTLTLPLTVEFLGPLDWGPVIGGYIASMFLAAVYVAIGLFVSSRTDNQIVSLIITAIVGGLFYLIGSDWIVALAPYWLGDILQLIGTSSRFDAIQRGVLDLRDLYYFVSLVAVFLALSVYSLEKIRWGSDTGGAGRHNAWRAAVALVVVNFLVANVWLHPITSVRIDMTANNRYSLSDATRAYMASLSEPLVIKGYFSRDTHPLLEPLVPQMRNLLREYDVVGGDNVRVSFVDPTANPEAARTARSEYGIEPISLRTASRYKTSVVNAYFNVVVKYGNQHTVLGYRDLIEIKRNAGRGFSVALSNPEYEITRSIRKVAHKYHSSGNLLASLEQPVTVHAYVSPASKLPDALDKLRSGLEDILDKMQSKAPDKINVKFQPPMAGDGKLAKRLQKQYGFRPMTTSLLSDRRFWFYLVLEQGQQTVPVQTPRKFSKDNLRASINAALKRLGDGYLKTVAIYGASGSRLRRRMMGNSQDASYSNLLRVLRENTAVTTTDLRSGQVPSDADMLIVLDPDTLNAKQRFAIDQFLMSGGTVMIAASPIEVSIGRRAGIQASKQKTGLADWLANYGVDIRSSLVLDPQSANLVLPMRGPRGRIRLRSVEYPYFPYVRGEGLADVPMLGTLRQVTMAWTSPVVVDDNKAGTLDVTPLIQSSPQAWTSKRTDVTPNYQKYPGLGFPLPEHRGRKTLAVMLEGRFTSAFKNQPSPLSASNGQNNETRDKNKNQQNKGSESESSALKITSVIEHSPDDARLIVFGSSSFASDAAMRIIGQSAGSGYLKPAKLVQNIVDWSTGDKALLSIRGGDYFSRLLRPISKGMMVALEVANYVVAAGGLLIIFLIYRGLADRRRRYYERILNKEDE